MNNLKDLNDRELVQQYQAGADAAFDELLLRHKDRLYTYITCNTIDKNTADDIFQETFVRVVVALREGTYTDTGRFGGWLVRIAHNLIIDSHRAGQVLDMTDDDSSDLSLGEAAGAAEETLALLNQKELVMNQVAQMVEELPQRQREVIRLHYFEQKTFREIAEATGTSVNTALGWMHYAVGNIRRMAAERGVSLEV